MGPCLRYEYVALSMQRLKIDLWDREDNFSSGLLLLSQVSRLLLFWKSIHLKFSRQDEELPGPDRRYFTALKIFLHGEHANMLAGFILKKASCLVPSYLLSTRSFDLASVLGKDIHDAGLLIFFHLYVLELDMCNTLLARATELPKTSIVPLYLTYTRPPSWIWSHGIYRDLRVISRSAFMTVREK